MLRFYWSFASRCRIASAGTSRRTQWTGVGCESTYSSLFPRFMRRCNFWTWESLRRLMCTPLISFPKESRRYFVIRQYYPYCQLFPQFRLQWLVREFNNNLPSELDFRSDAQNAQKMRHLFKGDPELSTPLHLPVRNSHFCFSFTPGTQHNSHLDHGVRSRSKNQRYCKGALEFPVIFSSKAARNGIWSCSYRFCNQQIIQCSSFQVRICTLRPPSRQCRRTSSARSS